MMIFVLCWLIHLHSSFGEMESSSDESFDHDISNTSNEYVIDEGEDTESNPSECEDDDTGGTNDAREPQGLQLYMFKPQMNEVHQSKNIDDSESDDADDSDGTLPHQETPPNVERIGNSNWCVCSGCEPMTPLEESICCKEVASIPDEFYEGMQMFLIINYFSRYIIPLQILNSQSGITIVWCHRNRTIVDTHIFRSTSIAKL